MSISKPVFAWKKIKIIKRRSEYDGLANQWVIIVCRSIATRLLVEIDVLDLSFIKVALKFGIEFIEVFTRTELSQTDT